MKKFSVPYRLGIDLGTNSLGFALVELKDEMPIRPIHMGVRIFSDGREAKTGASLAVDRRTARGMRRRRDRFLRRQQQLMQLLVEAGLMPQDKQERKKLELLDPYQLRAKGLDEKLTFYELGRALFHLNQRRGFQSNRKQAEQDKSESSKVSEGIKRLKNEMEKHEDRTIGEFFNRLHNKERPLRVRPHLTETLKKIAQPSDEEDNTENSDAKKSSTPYEFYPQRRMFHEEYDLLLQKQAEYHPALLTSEAIGKLRKIIFYQRDLCPVTRGRCTALGAGYFRAYAALPSSQYFRLLKEVNNLKIQDRLIRRNRHDLSDEQREKAITYLSGHSEVKFSSLAKKIGLLESESFNLESDIRDKIYGLETAVTLSNKKCFGALWPSSLRAQDNIVRELLEKNEKENEIWLHQNYPALSGEQIDKIISATASLEDGTLRYSSEALEQLIPQLESKEEETGLYKDEYKAVISCGWPYASHYTGEVMMDDLPYYGRLLERKTQAVKYGSTEEKEYGRIANPTVHVALNQLRKVVNSIIEEYGHPKEIAIEFSRELKLTKEEKKNRNSANRDNQKSNDRYDKDAREAGVAPSSDTRLRQKLWEQQDRCCAYSGKKLGLSEVLSSEVEIDHILPRETLDDSNANKVVVLKALNQFKRKRTPYQAFHEDRHPDVNWDQLLLRTEKTIPGKRWRFEQDAMERFEKRKDSGDEGWLARQLTDTSYIARVAREYLRYVVGDRVPGYPAVDTYPGGVTAKLRRGWGLNSLLNPESDEKNRDDHRHHAIDALVIACANRSLLQQISRASAIGAELGEAWYKHLSHEVPPYTHFDRNTLQKQVDEIVVSHKPDHGSPGKAGGTSGKLHDDTFYGKSRNQKGLKEGRINLRIRKSLTDSEFWKTNTMRKVARICDPYIRKKLAYYIDHHKDEKLENAVLKFGQENNIRRIRLLCEENQAAFISIKDKEGKPYKWMLKNSNHHIDVFCPVKNNDVREWYGETISTFEANQKDYEPQWKKDHPAAKLVMRLHMNDMVAYEEDGKREIRKVKEINERIVLVPHNLAKKAKELKGKKEVWTASVAQLRKKNARKIAVTPSGKVLDPGKAPMPKPFAKKADVAA